MSNTIIPTWKKLLLDSPYKIRTVYYIKPNEKPTPQKFKNSFTAPTHLLLKTNYDGRVCNRLVHNCGCPKGFFCLYIIDEKWHEPIRVGSINDNWFYSRVGDEFAT